MDGGVKREEGESFDGSGLEGAKDVSKGGVLDLSKFGYEGFSWGVLSEPEFATVGDDGDDTSLVKEMNVGQSHTFDGVP